jgi:DNA-binding transcriptional ArsR family regulator
VIEFLLDTTALGTTVFGFSPLAEAASSLLVVSGHEPNQVHHPWIRDVRDRLRGLDLGLLLAVAPSESRWLPDFLYPPVHSPRTSIDSQLSVVAGLTADDLVSDLADVWPGAAWPSALENLLHHGADAGKLLATELSAYWDAAVAPYWTRMTHVLEEDVAFRAMRSLERGLFALLDDVHPRVSRVGHRLLLDLPGHADATYGEAKLILVPSIFRWPGLVLTHATPGAFEITYGARGAARVWEGLGQTSREAGTLDSLLGRTRSMILQRLDVPRSTTELAREFVQSPASVSRHLTTLRDGGLATSWRTGRVVLYQQTPLGTSLVELNRSG